MLYVFLVDTGVMFTFEMELAMESVETLMKRIASTLMIPIEKQVLIMEGGEALDPSYRICNYTCAGTENSPVFLFSKRSIESPMPPSPSLNLGSETSLKEEVELSLKLPPTYETLVSRTYLAMRFQDMACELSQSCVSLVSEQNLQRQGWLAVIANLENIASTFQTRGTILEQTYSEFVEIIPQYKSLLDNFNKVILLLSKIPVFACLIQNDMKTLISKDKDVTLLDWINAQDKRNSLEDMVQQCQDALEQIQNVSLLEIRGNRDQVLDDVSNKPMKEIGGLEERLNMLSRLCENARAVAEKQSDMAQGFSQNQIRAQNIGDPSVLPDLCSSHRQQLSLLLHNHSQLRDIRRRCAKAKDELSGNLHARLKWVMMIEKKICECDNKLVLYHESIKRIKKRVEILEQINLAPRVYASTVKEVVRRRDFASLFTKWAKSVSHKSEEIYTEEVARRHEFSQFVGHHFLQNLFTGINNMPTPFAETAPEVFDVDLPAITFKELKELMTNVPDLIEHMDTIDIANAITDKENTPTFLKMKSLSCGLKQFIVETSEDDVDNSGEASLSRAGEGSKTKHLEKHDDLSQSAENEISCAKSTVERKESLGTGDETEVTLNSKEIDENNDVATATYGRTKNSYTNTEQQDTSSKIISSNLLIKENVEVNIRKMRDELKQLALVDASWKKDANKYFTQLFEQLKLTSRFERLTEETKSAEVSEVKRLTVEVKLSTKKISSLIAENESLRAELKTKDETFSESVTRYRTELERQKQLAKEMELAKQEFEAEQQIRFNSAINKVKKEKEVSLKKANEELTELKNMQQRNEEKLQVLFNEKEELRQEKAGSVKKLAEAFVEFASRETQLNKCVEEIRNNLEEKEKQFTEQLENEKKEAAAMLEAEKQKSEDSSGSGKIISELVVDRFHKRIKHLEEENTLLRDQLKSGAEGEGKILFVELQQSFDAKCKECDSLRKELELLQKSRSPQAVFKDFQKGDIVEVFYNDQYGLYMIRATGETLYFVHPDSLVNLDVPPPEESKSSIFHAQVLDKEYCQAKKANNRFKVAVGTKFYRVKVRSCVSPT